PTEHIYLHSFPTRRSSDLMLETKLDIIDVDSTGRIISVRNTTGNYNETSNPGGFGLPNPTKSQVQSIIFTLSHYNESTINQVRLDRKSTRLNSSHVKISYA